MSERNFQVFREVNHWWMTEGVRSDLIELVEREILTELLPAIEDRQMILIEGPRRVGKTSLLYQLINKLMRQGINPKRLFYLSLDDPLLEKATLFEDIISFIEAYITEGPLSHSKERMYLFLDEVVKLPNWELYLKRYYDLKYPFKFIVTSSAAAFLKKRTKESLVGRAVSYALIPFSFCEFLQLNSVGSDVVALYRRLRQLWAEELLGGELYELYGELRRLEKKLSFYESELTPKLRLYLREGGFPEYLRLANSRLKERYFWDNVAERIIFYDIPELFGVQDRELLQKILIYCVENSGQMLNLVDLANSFGAPRQTITTYLSYLQAGMLVQLLEKYAKTAASRMRSYKKVYTLDTGLFVNLQRLNPEALDAKGLWGWLAEIAVFQHLRRLFPRARLYYYRDRHKEVDFVLEQGKLLQPFEVKYRGDISVSELRGFQTFQRKFGAHKGIVVTKETLDLKNGVLLVPLKLFLS